MTGDDMPIDGLDELSTPPPPGGFWNDLSTAVQLRQPVHPNGADPAVLDDQMPSPNRRGRRPLVVTVAAAAVVSMVGLGAVVRWRDEGGPASPAASSVTSPATRVSTSITDPLHIDLAPWATNPPDTAPGPFTVIDLENLPAGWNEVGSSGYHLAGDPDPAHYRWGATLRAVDGREATVYIGSPPTALLDAGAAVTVHGQPALTNGDIVTWTDTNGISFMVSSTGATVDELVEIANLLPITTIPALPILELGDPAPSPDDDAGTVRLAGTAAGVPWAVTSAPDATTRIVLTVDGTTHSSGEGVARTLDSTWDLHINGLGSAGTLLHGIAPARTDTLVLELDTATITLPIAHDDTGNSIYAVPIEPGLRPHRLTLLTADGTAVTTVELPRFLIPSVGTGTYGDRPLNSPFPIPPDFGNPPTGTTSTGGPATSTPS